MTNMDRERPRAILGSGSGFLSLPSSLLFLFALLSTSASGQSLTSTPALISKATPVRTSSSQATHPQSMITSAVSATISNNMTASATSTAPISKEILPDSSHTEDANENAFRYYWLILAIFGIAVAGLLWWINRRRIKRKEQLRLSGRNALARDMEGWTTTRRWYRSAWAPNQTRAFARQEEGLDEHGEPPPPYRPKGDMVVTQDSATGLSIPLRTLSGEQPDAARPPDYR